MNINWKKKVSAWITYPILVIFAFTIVAVPSYFYVRHVIAQTFLVGFEGKLVSIEYNCLCNLGIMLTVEPKVITRGQGQMQLMFYYAPQILEQLGIDWSIGGVQLPIPRMYLWTPYVAYGQQTLGNYIPGSFQCWAYVGEGCSVNGTAQGAILNIGSSLL